MVKLCILVLLMYLSLINKVPSMYSKSHMKSVPEIPFERHVITEMDLNLVWGLTMKCALHMYCIILQGKMRLLALPGFAHMVYLVQTASKMSLIPI